MKRLNRFHIAILALLVVHLFIRIPTIFEPAYLDDENLFITIGRSMLNGSVLYKDISDAHPARLHLFYLLAGLSGNHTNFRFLTLIMNSVSVILFFIISLSLCSNIIVSFLISIMFIFATSSPIFGGNIPQTELFFIPLILGSVFLLLRAMDALEQKRRSLLFLFSGFVMGLGILMKLQVFFDAIAISLALFIILLKKNPRLSVRQLLEYIFGFSFPFTIILASSIFQGLTFHNITFLFNSGIDLVRSRSLLHGYASVLDTTYAKLIMLAFFSIFLYIFRTKISVLVLLLALWTFSAMLASFLFNYIGFHYTLQALPLLLLIPLIIKQKLLFNRLVSVFPLLVFILFHFIYPYSYRPTLVYYKNFLDYISNKSSRRDYYSTFSPFISRNYKVAEVLKGITTPKERIFVWSLFTEIYTLSDTLPSTKYVFHEVIDSFNAYEETIKQLETIRPRFIVTFEEYPMPNEQILLDYIHTNYIVYTKYYSDPPDKYAAIIYIRKNSVKTH